MTIFFIAHLCMIYFAQFSTGPCVRDKKICNFENMYNEKFMSDEYFAIQYNNIEGSFSAGRLDDIQDSSARVSEGVLLELLSFWPKYSWFADYPPAGKGLVCLGVVHFQDSVILRAYHFETNDAVFVLGYVTRARRLMSTIELATDFTFVSTSLINSMIINDRIYFQGRFATDVGLAVESLPGTDRRRLKSLLPRCYTLRLRKDGTWR